MAQQQITITPIERELLAIAEEMRATAAVRAERDPQPDTALSSWAGRIERAILRGETMETALQAATAKALAKRAADANNKTIAAMTPKERRASDNIRAAFAAKGQA